MPVERNDLDRIEDNLRSELAWLRGRIDGGVDRQCDYGERIQGLEERLNSIKEEVDKHGEKIWQFYYLLLIILITVVGVLGAFMTLG